MGHRIKPLLQKDQRLALEAIGPQLIDAIFLGNDAFTRCEIEREAGEDLPDIWLPANPAHRWPIDKIRRSQKSAKKA